MPKKQKIILEDDCFHISKPSYKLKKYTCNDRYCQKGKITPEDIVIIEIGFNIFIIFNYLKDLFPEKKKLLKLFLDEDEEDDEEEQENEKNFEKLNIEKELDENS